MNLKFYLKIRNIIIYITIVICWKEQEKFPTKAARPPDDLKPLKEKL